MATILYENRDLAECRNEIIKCYIRDLIEEQNRVKEKAEITSLELSKCFYNIVLYKDNTIFIDFLNNITCLDDITILSVKTLNGIVNTTIDKKIQYTPNNDYCGQDCIIYMLELEDIHIPGSIQLNIIDENKISIVDNDSIVINEDTSIYLDILTINGHNMQDINCNVTTIKTTISNGETLVLYDKLIYYTPKLNYFGSDIIHYSIHRNGMEDIQKTVEIYIKPEENDGIITNTIIYTEGEITIDITNYITNIDSQLNNLVISSIDTPSNGIIRKETDRQINYQPNEDFQGIDRINYKIKDSLKNMMDILI